MITKVLAALDGSARGPGVFHAAVEMAARFGSTLHVLRAVIVPPEFPAAGAGTLADPLPAHLVKVALQDLSRLTSRASGQNVRLASPVVRIGEPWRVILELSNELDVDLVVIGSHGYSTIDRLLGTTAGRVANLATRDVLVVHERSDRLPPAQPGPAPYR